MTYTHRWSQGLQFLASSTLSKYLDNADGQESWAVPGSSNYQNYYNLSAEKSLDGDDIPKSLVLTYIYQMPVGRGKHLGTSMSGPLNPVVGGWQVSGVTTFKDGFPLGISTATNFRCEMCQAFNHPLFHKPNTTFGNASFGKITTAFPGRDVQFAFKLPW